MMYYVLMIVASILPALDGAILRDTALGLPQNEGKRE
jgi:hypothetical protein